MTSMKLYAAAAAVAASVTTTSLVAQANGNFCGSSWVDAVGCARACPSGAPSGCGAGETCFANTPCTEEAAPPPTPPIVRPQQQQQQQQQQPWGNPGVNSNTQSSGGGSGTCGDGNRGNGECANPAECCSTYGHCGTTPAHCDATCGGGNRGDGRCPDPAECCSKHGHCGTSALYCDDAPVPAPAAPDNLGGGNVPPPSTGGAAPSVFGSCGGGDVGNTICPDNNECCSQYGFCGTTPAHCNNKVGNLGPNYSQTGGQLTQQTQQSQQVVQQPQFQSTPQTPQFNQNGVLVPAQAQQQQPAAPQQFGSCGGGDTGNGICPVNADCCSEYGFCGTTLNHCTNKVGPSFPGQPQGASSGTGAQPGQRPVGNPQQAQQMQTQQAQFGGDQQQQTQQVQQTQLGGGQQQQQQQPQFGDWQQQQQQQQTTQFGNGPVPGTYPTLSNNGNVNNVQNGPPAPPIMPHGTSKKIIGYYAGWQWYDRDKLAKPSNMDFTKLQRVNYAFFQPDAAGNIFGTDSWGDPQLLFGAYSSKIGGGVQRCSWDGPTVVNCAYHEHNAGLIHQAHQQGAEVYPSIGGWTLSDNFPTLSADPVARNNFAQKCIEILTYHDFDGIDIDWEYPGYEEHSGTPADTENFTKMLAAIRAALETLTRSTGKVYGLTAAMPCPPKHIENIEVGKLTTLLTEFNLMSYDFHGAWDEVTGVDAPLYYQGFGNEEFNIHRCVENYVALGVPRDRINIGLPFYGRSFKFASKLNQNHGGNDLANWPEDDGTPQYYNVYNKLPNMIQMRDNKSKTQYAYISHSEQSSTPAALSLPEGLVSFDDERAICDKVHYAQENNLAGFIIWELSGDILDDLRTPLLDITNRKLGNPSLECCMLHSAEECEKERLERDSETHSQMGGFDSSRWAGAQVMSNSGRGQGSTVVLVLALIPTTFFLFW